MTSKRIFVTGASGCIGHYIVETLSQRTDWHLYLLVRDPQKLRFDWEHRSNITVLKADLRDVGRFAELLKTMHAAVLTAAVWGGMPDVFDINVAKTVQLLNLLDTNRCEQVIYFSTASLLDRDRNLLKEAGHLGTDYIRTKYQCLQRIAQLPIARKLTILFPTLVLGGDTHHPYSHLSAGFAELPKWLGWARFFKADGSFHFIHARDIACIVEHFLESPPQERQWVLGNSAVTVNQLIEEACAYFDLPVYLRLPLPIGAIDPLRSLLKLLGTEVHLSAWDRFCLTYRNFTYKDPITPASFGLETTCSTFTEALKLSEAVFHDPPSNSDPSDTPGDRPDEASSPATDREPSDIAAHSLPTELAKTQKNPY